MSVSLSSSCLKGVTGLQLSLSFSINKRLYRVHFKFLNVEKELTGLDQVKMD